MKYIPKHFKAHEFVPPSIFNKRGDKSFELIDSRILMTMDKLREMLGRPITVNNYYWGGSRSQSGLRTLDFYGSTSKYESSLSQHKYGRAVDFLVKGMSAVDVRKFIVDNKEHFPYITFMETDISWVHIDCRNCEAITTWSPERGFTGVK